VASLVVNTFPQAFLEVLHHSLQNVRRNCCHFFPDVLFQIHRCPWFLFVHLALEISPEEEVLRLWTLIPMNIEVPTKYQRSHNDRIVVFENRLHSKSPILYSPALHGNWNALCLARTALKDKFPTPTVPPTAVLPNRQVFLTDPIYIYIYIYGNRIWLILRSEGSTVPLTTSHQSPEDHRLHITVTNWPAVSELKMFEISLQSLFGYYNFFLAIRTKILLLNK